MRGVLRVDPKAHLICVVLRLRGDAVHFCGELEAARLRLFPRGFEQTLGLHGRVLDQDRCLLLGDPEDGFELQARPLGLGSGLGRLDKLVREGGDLLLCIVGLSASGSEIGFQCRDAVIVLRLELGDAGFALCDRGLEIGSR